MINKPKSVRTAKEPDHDEGVSLSYWVSKVSKNTLLILISCLEYPLKNIQL